MEFLREAAVDLTRPDCNISLEEWDLCEEEDDDGVILAVPCEKLAATAEL